MTRATVQINLRIKPELRDRLQQIATERGVSVTREINERLAASFEQKPTLEDEFGSKRLAATLAFAGSVMRFVGRLLMPYSLESAESDAWLEDPFIYDQATQAAISVLHYLRPEGNTDPPEAFSSINPNIKNTGKLAATGLVWQLAGGMQIQGISQEQSDRFRANIEAAVQRLTMRVGKR